MASRQSNRLEMLINITSKGGPELSKLGSAAKKLGAIFDHLDKAMEKAELTTREGRGEYKRFAGNIKGLMAETNKYSQAKQKLNKELRKDPSKQNAATIDKLRSATAKAMSAAKSYGKSVNEIVPGLVKLNFTKKEVLKNTKLLAQAEGQAAAKAKNFIGVTKQKDRATNRSSSAVKKNTIDIKKNTIEVKKNEFANNQLRQRLDTTGGGAFARMRRSAGALRNQLLLLTFATAALRSAFNSSFAAANELEASLKGLGAVAINTGASFEGAKQAALDLNKQGLLSIQDAAAGLKNLLSSGFGLPEAIKLMNTLTDAASFNRQGTLALGQAVVGATQGIKNQNSIMVDNAGITKNLSIMYKEYAASIGTSAGKLDEAQKRQAIFNGILKEGAVFAGNADAVINTMAGSLTVLGVNSQLAAAEMGKLVQPLASGFVKAFADSSKAIETFAKGIQDSDTRMVAMLEIGYKIEDFFSSVALVAGNAGKAISGLVLSIVNFSIGGVSAAGSLLKYIVVMKAFSAITGRVTMTQAAANEQLMAGNAIYKINTRQVLFQDAAYKNLNGTLTMVKLQYASLNVNMKAVSFSLTGMSNLISNLGAKFMALGTAIKVTTGSSSAFIGGMTLAVNTLGRAFFSLFKFALRFSAILFAFNIVSGIIGKFTGWNEALEQTEKNANRNTTALEALRQQIAGLDGQINRTLVTSRKFTDQLSNQSAYLIQSSIVKSEQQKLVALRSQFNKDMSLKEQAALQVQIDKQIEGLEKEQALLTEYQKKIEALNAEHEARIAGGIVRLNAQKTILQKRQGVEDVLTAFQTHLDILDQQADFHKTKLAAVDQNNFEILQAEKDYAQASLFAEQEVNFQRAELLKQGFNKMESIRTQYDKKMIESDLDELGRIKKKYENLRRVEVAGINAIADSMVGSETAGNTALGASYADATRSMGGVDVGQSVPGGGYGTGQLKEFIALQGKLKETLANTNLTEAQRNAILTDYNKKLDIQKANFQLVIDTYKQAGDGKEQIAYFNEINKQIDTQKESIGKLGTQYSAYTDQLDKSKTRVDEINKQREETINKAKEQLNNEELMMLGAAMYREDLRQLGNTYKELTNQVMLYGDANTGLLSQLDRNLMFQKDLNNVTEQYRNSVQGAKSMLLEFLNPMQTSDDLIRKQAEATDKLALKQAEAQAKAKDNVTLAKLQAEQEQAQLDYMESKPALFAKEIGLQKLRRDAADEKVRATEKEIEVLEKLNDIEKQALLDNNSAERVQQQIANFQKYAEFFSGFIGKMQDLESNRLMANMKYQKSLNKEVMNGVLNQKQADALALENMKVTRAEKAKQEKLALAGLIRDVGRQIMVYAAKKAAERGQIGQALGLLAAGVAANALINSYANKITREAESDYMDAQNRFERREAEIRGEGDNQAGSANQQRFGGSIKAQNLSVEINPTVVIQGEQVFIGQGSVNEFGAELQSLLLTSVNDAIENREIDLSNVSDRG